MDQRGASSSQPAAPPTAPPKRHYTPRGTGSGLQSLKRTKSEPGPLPSVRKLARGSSGISGRCRSDGSVIVKGNWTDSEDERLVELVHHFLDGKRDPKGIASTRWSEIAKELPGRVGKQCRERWHNHLRPDINKGRWSFLEEVMIYLCWRNWNSQWARISRILQGRSDNRVKNHWNCHMKRRLTRDPPYFDFMENCHKALSHLIDFDCEDDLDEHAFRANLVPRIEQFLSENQELLDRLPGFSTSRREREPNQQPAPCPRVHAAQTSFPNMAPVRPSAKRPAPKVKSKPPKRRRQEASSSSEESMTYSVRTPAWWVAASPERQQQRELNNEENKYGSRDGGGSGSPSQYYGNYAAAPCEEHYAVEVKQEFDYIGNAGGSTGSNYLYSTEQQQQNYRSPVPSCAMEVVMEENGSEQPVLFGDPLWSRAVSTDYSAASPMYFTRTAGGNTLTSTPLKPSSVFNVPYASECGAHLLLSPYLEMRQFHGFHAEEDALLSPIRRSFCGEPSTIDETMWSPSKAHQQPASSSHHQHWTPVKLGSIVNVVKTPQAIREALASSEVNRSRISPEDLASPSRLFSDASELIDGELSRSGMTTKDLFSTPQSVLKCRRRLTDHWSNGTPSFGGSSGYESFQTSSGGQL